MVSFYLIMWKNITDPDRPHMKIKYGACALHTGFLRLQTHTLRICNNHCFSTAITVARTRLNVTLYVHGLSCFILRATRRLSQYSQFPSSGICHLVVCFMNGTVFEEPVSNPSWLIFLRNIDIYQNLWCFQLESHNLHLYISGDLRSCIIFTSFSFCIPIY